MGEDSRDEELKKAYSFSYRWLSKRALLCRDLIQKLQEKAIEEEVALEVVDRLTKEGYLDDTSWAQGKIRSRIRAGDGPVKIRHLLRQEGFADEQINSLFDEELGSEVQRELIERFLDKQRVSPKTLSWDQRARLRQKAFAKGHLVEELDDVLERYEQEAR